jgi:NAD(P)-dependent dehydrogenase (short-subunit alcohol dehydrogenase family)
MSGKVALVTGANSGIGRVTALELTRMGASVVASGRDREKLKAAVLWIRGDTGNMGVEPIAADLSSQAEVRRLADEFKERHDRLDVLVNNAGLILGERQMTVDGLEATFAVNHLAPFLLTNLLRDRLEKAAPSRVITVASAVHQRVRHGLDFDDLQSKRRYRTFDVYSRSKLANVLFTRALARKLEGTGVTANALHPGVVRSGFGQDGDVGGFLGVLFGAARLFMISPEEGARTTLHLATSPEVEKLSGRYFVKCRPVEPSMAARDDAAAERLWMVSERMTGLAA